MSASSTQASARGLRPNRLHVLMAAGLVDSFGLALGWTVFNLHAVTSHGLATVGVYNAAMLIGIALSAPATAFLSSRLDGRHLLQATALGEAVLRVGSFLLLLYGAPVAVVALAVALMNVLAWTGYAGMRAEVAAVSSKAAAMTWYMVCIASIEAAGTAAAALLPAGSSGAVTGPLLASVIVWYAVCLAPQLAIGHSARVSRSLPRRRRRPRLSRRSSPFAGGFAVMLLASGPTFLSVGLAVEFHGRSWVAAAAVAFTAGSLVAPLLAAVVERASLPARVSWPLLGTGMIVGWIAAPWHPGGLLLAQVLAGLCMTTFEGTMDARAAADDSDGRVTASLAWSASARAFGSAIAVALIPVAITTSRAEIVSGAAAAVLVATAALAAAPLARRISWPLPGRRTPRPSTASSQGAGAGVPVRSAHGSTLTPQLMLANHQLPATAREPISPALALVDPQSSTGSRAASA